MVPPRGIEPLFTALLFGDFVHFGHPKGRRPLIRDIFKKKYFMTNCFFPSLTRKKLLFEFSA
ncbi:MAG: hypothetical protein D3910_07630 [Candidatus Electrothrix sp. ATG2]|nr:hypothetical protein [Candidatus Electrothrix sp. ATG2]